MNLEGFKIRATQAPWKDAIDLYFWRNVQGKVTLIEDLIAHTYDNDGQTYEQNPPMSLHTEQAQELMDALWTVGIRPSEGTGSAGAMKAAQDHIKDLQGVTKDFRDIAMKLLPK